MGRSNLGSLTRAFAEQLQGLLNGTVCDDARVTAMERPPGDTWLLGTNLANNLQQTPVRLRSTSTQHHLWLTVQIATFLDPEGYLTVSQSYFGISAVPDDNDPIFHFDYERDKAGYTEAHLQIFAENEKLTPIMQALCTSRKKKSMGELHLPVGGRRFRPSLEDVLEFLIDEELVDGKPGWRDILNATREPFRRIQLKATIRQQPEAAIEILSKMGYTITGGPVEPPRRGRRKPGKLRSSR